MDKHERVTEQYLVRDPILELADPAAYRREVEHIASILRREFPDERNAALIEAEKTCRAIEDGKFVAGAVWHNDAGSCAAAIRALQSGPSPYVMLSREDALKRLLVETRNIIKTLLPAEDVKCGVVLAKLMCALNEALKEKP